ncbi:hypothetical protein GCM10020255_024380 [Rhodococcus baikonurensis]
MEGKRHEHKGPVWKDELAKDVAAMANSGGGIIVVGVSEDKPTSKAVGFDEPVQWNDLDARKYREVIYNNTHPPVSDVTFDNLVDREDRCSSSPSPPRWTHRTSSSARTSISGRPSGMEH